MKLSEIKKAYNNLSLITYKNKYLIPNRPIRPVNPYVMFGKSIGASLRKAIQQNHPGISSSQKWKAYHQLIKQKIQQNHPTYVQLRADYDELFQKYRISKSTYKKQYLDPPLIYYRYRPFTIFCSQIFNQSRNLDRKINLKEIGEKWNQLSKQQKQEITKKCNQQKQKYLQTFQKYVDNHKIPVLKAPTGLNVFVSQHFQNTNEEDDQEQNQELKIQQNVGPSLRHRINVTSPEFVSKYAELPQTQKKKYETIAKARKQISDKLYNQFLRKWDITHKQLQHIKLICQVYEKNSKISKENKKILSNIEEDQQPLQNNEKFHEIQSEQLLLQQIPKKKKNTKIK